MYVILVVNIILVTFPNAYLNLFTNLTIFLYIPHLVLPFWPAVSLDAPSPLTTTLFLLIPH